MSQQSNEDTVLGKNIIEKGEIRRLEKKWFLLREEVRSLNFLFYKIIVEKA
jgi:hypothetical protein